MTDPLPAARGRHTATPWHNLADVLGRTTASLQISLKVIEVLTLKLGRGGTFDLIVQKAVASALLAVNKLGDVPLRILEFQS